MNPHDGQPAVAPAKAPAIADHELFHPIASGSYGEVWFARNAVGTPRAVKIVRRDQHASAESFDREFKGLQKFEPVSRAHEGLVDILTLGRLPDDAGFYYVMELADNAGGGRIDGRMDSWINGRTPTGHQSTNPPIPYPAAYTARTLRHDLKQHGHLPVAECIQLGLKLTAALAHLHAQGLVHRDVKPSNILLIGGEPKLADAGLVAAVDDARSLVGTAGYIAPEGPGSPQADLYALGKVLYEAAFGKDRQDFPQLPTDLRSRPDHAGLLELNAVILKACHHDPRQRYQSAQEMAADLTLLQRGRSVRHQRAVEQRFAMAKKIALPVIVLALLIATLPFLKGSKYDHTPTPEAARLYELARWHLNKLTPEAHKKAIEYVNQALEADPRFVKPYRELTAIYVWNTGGLFASKEEHRRRLKEIADKMLAMDPRLAEGHAALSFSLFLEPDWRGAEDEIVRAIELDPDYPVARDIYSFYLSMLGRADEAQRQAQRSQELDPTARTTAMVAAWPFMAARQFDKAIAQLQRAVELDKHFPEAHVFLGRCYEAQSNYLAAIEEYKAADLSFDEDPEETARLYAAWRQAYDTGGEKGYWQKRLEDLLKLRENERESRFIAGCYAKLGEKEKALDTLERYFNVMRRHELKFDPLLDSLHDKPRFKALLKKAGLEK